MSRTHACLVLYLKPSIDYPIQCRHYVNGHYTVCLRSKRNIYIYIPHKEALNGTSLRLISWLVHAISEAIFISNIFDMRAVEFMGTEPKDVED